MGYRIFYLHDDEFKDQWQLSDVTGGQVKQKWSVPHRVWTTGSFGLLGTNNIPILTQVYDNVVVCGGKVTSTVMILFYLSQIFFCL